MVYTRHESMTSTTKRHPAKMQGRLSADRYGTITGMVFEGDFNTGAYASWGPTVATRVPIHASGPYRVPHYFAEASAIHTNGPVAERFAVLGCRRLRSCRKNSWTGWQTLWDLTGFEIQGAECASGR